MLKTFSFYLTLRISFCFCIKKYLLMYLRVNRSLPLCNIGHFRFSPCNFFFDLLPIKSFCLIYSLIGQTKTKISCKKK